MINPSEVGKSGEMIRLHTLESVWIQGKLRMWGRWSYIGGGKSGNMFNQLLSSKKITKTAIKEALRRIKNAGIKKPELEEFLREIMNSNKKSHLAHCTDNEALIIDKVVVKVLADHPALIELLHERYDGTGKSRRKMAEEQAEKHPDWSFITCRRRVDTWLSFAESALYAPMCDAFSVNSSRFLLQNEPETD